MVKSERLLNEVYSMRYFPLFVVLLLTGCVSPGAPLDKSQKSATRNIHIMPIEGPPLSATNVSRARLSGSEWMSLGLTSGNNSLAVVSGIVMLLSAPEANSRSEMASQAVESLLDIDGIWEPTAEVAQEAAIQLEMDSSYTVLSSDQVSPLPGVKKREASFFMENWMRPLRSWYNASESPFDYSDLDVPGVVLEVGMLNYELSGGRFLVQVCMKVVDPVSGAVLARARSFSSPKADVVSLFADNADGYKQLFRATTKPLIAKNIAKLGLID